MSSKVYGRTLNNNAVVVYPPAFADFNIKKSATPLSGSVGSTHLSEMVFSVDDKLYFDDIMLDFTAATSDATNYVTIQNPFLLLAEIMYFKNNQLVTHLKNTEEVYTACSHNLRAKCKNEQEFWGTLQRLRSTELGKTFNGDVLNGTLYYSLPLSLLFPEIVGLNTIDGLSKIGFQWRFQPDYATASQIGRFALNATVTNGWTSSKITISDVQTRLEASKYFLPTHIPRAPNPVSLLNKFELKQYTMTFNSVNTDQQRVSLLDFSQHSKILGMYAYVFPSALVTAYNDADCNKVYSNGSYLGWVVNYKSQTYLDMDHDSQDKKKRINYNVQTMMKRHGHPPLAAVESAADATHNYYINGVYIDLASIHALDADTEPIGGISTDQNLEVVFYCATALGAGNHTLNVVLHYVELETTDPKTGIVKIAV